MYRLVLVLALIRLCPAATLPPGFRETNIVTGFAWPTAMAVAPDGRLFVLTQQGGVLVVRDGRLLPDAALSLAVDSEGERGLLGIALDPDFSANGYVYLHYTVPRSLDARPFNQVARFTMRGDTIDSDSRMVLLNMEPLSEATNHNGGGLRFGPDRQLYVGVGDNADAPNSQKLTNKLGKVLRIDPNTGAPSVGNPFVDAPGAAPEIWAYGLRNPFQFAFSPEDGTLFVNDVGLTTWEEINEGVKGGNYGWPLEEGGGPDPALLDPIYRYANPDEGCAITGGVFYPAAQQAFGPEYSGKYFFADFCAGWIRTFDPLTRTAAEFAAGIEFGLVDLALSPSGGIYYLTGGGGGQLTLLER